MIVTFLAFVLPLALLFFADVEMYLAANMYLYGLVLCYRYANRQWAVMDAGFFLLFSFVLLLQSVLGIQKLIPFTGSLIYGFLSVLFFLGSWGMPVLPGRNQCWEPEKKASRKIGSAFLCLSNITALIFSVVLFPSVLYIVLPLAISLSGVALSFFLPTLLMDLGARVRSRFFMNDDERKTVASIFGNVRGLIWISESLYAKEAVSDREREKFFEVIEKGYYAIYQKSQKSDKGKYRDFMGRVKDEFKQYADRSTPIVVYDGRLQSYVGSIRIVTGGSGRRGRLPLETSLPVSLLKAAKTTGPMAEAGRLVILSNGAMRARVLESLIALMVVKSLLAGIRMIFTDAMEASVPLYEKMGMQRIAGPFVDDEFSQKSHLCAMDIARTVGDDSQGIWKKMKSSPRAEATIRKYLRKIEGRNTLRRRLGKPVFPIGDRIERIMEGSEARP